MGDLTKDSLETIRQIASLQAMQVPREQIADVTGFELSELDAILENDEYKQFYKAFLAEEFNRHFQTARSWDDIEAKALRVVSEALDLEVDPEFALRAGVMANKANRHGMNRRVDPIDLQGGARRTITLTTTYINKIENATVVLDRKNGGDENAENAEEEPKPKIIDNGSSKVVDAVPLPEFRQLMGPSEPTDVDALAAVEEFFSA